MILKLVSKYVDGCRQTRVIDAETGENIEGITSVEWAHKGYDELPEMTLTLIDIDADIDADIDELPRVVATLSENFRRTVKPR